MTADRVTLATDDKTKNCRCAPLVKLIATRAHHSALRDRTCCCPKVTG